MAIIYVRLAKCTLNYADGMDLGVRLWLVVSQ